MRELAVLQGMSMHVTREQLDRLRDGTLPPATVAEIGRHAATCEDCGKTVRDSLSIDRMVTELRTQIDAGSDDGHLSQDALMAHADGMLQGRDLEIARVHLDECATCRSEIDEIHRLKELMQPRRPRRWTIYAVAASIAAIALILPLLSRRPVTVAPHIATRPIEAPPRSPSLTAGYGRSQWDQWVTDARKNRELPIPSVIREMRQPRSHVRGSAEEEDLRLWPDHTVVESSRPRFHWAARNAATYTVILRSDNGSIVVSDPLTDTEWIPAKDLERGREYEWQLESTVGGERSIHPTVPDPPARFRVLAQSALEEIAEARTRHPNDPLLHAVILARHGLRAEALESLNRLEKSDPALATALRESLGRWR